MTGPSASAAAIRMLRGTIPRRLLRITEPPRYFPGAHWPAERALPVPGSTKWLALRQTWHSVVAQAATAAAGPRKPAVVMRRRQGQRLRCRPFKVDARSKFG